MGPAVNMQTLASATFLRSQRRGTRTSFIKCLNILLYARLRLVAGAYRHDTHTGSTGTFSALHSFDQ